MSSRSSSENRSSNETITSTIDNRMAADGGSIVVRDGEVNVIDGGAIALAGDLSEIAFDLGNTALNSGTELAALGALVAGDALITAENLVDGGYAFADGLAADNAAITQAALQQSLGFASGVVGDSNALAWDLSEMSIDSGMDFAELSADLTFGAYGFAQDLAETAIYANQRNTEATLASTQAALSETLFSNQSEEGQISQNLIKIGLPALAIAIVASRIM
jgi:hypothetical protein